MKIQQNDFDLFLTWASYKGSGNWRDWRNAISNWKQDGSTEHNAVTQFAWQARYAFSALGHVDFDPGFRFQTKGITWQTAPAAFAGLPNAKPGNPVAVLCGRRCEDLLLKLRESSIGSRMKIIPQYRAPHCVQIRFKNERELDAVCKEFKIANAECASIRLLRALPPIEAWLANASENSFDVPFECFNVKSGKWEKNNFAHANLENALIRKRNRFAAHHYYLKHRGKWFLLPWQYGFCLASTSSVEPLIFYDHSRRSLFLKQPWMQLPALYLRSLVLCSGLLPHYCSRRRMLIFKNIPLEIAEGLAKRLNQALEKINEPSGKTLA